MSRHPDHTTPHLDRSATFPVPSVGLDGFELGLLTVLRHFCVSFADPQSQDWMQAYGFATRTWGISAGPKAAQALFTIFDAMRRSRRSVFQYANPACPVCSARLTANERHLMRMLHALRRNRVGEARTEAMLLVEGNDSHEVLAAGYGFARLFPAGMAVSG
ncbi:MAG: hypothetical protein V4712_00075 [Pseudomonadota bacterium]